MKRAIPILVLSSALLTGCGSYTDPGYSYTNVSPNETSVRAKIMVHLGSPWNAALTFKKKY